MNTQNAELEYQTMNGCFTPLHGIYARPWSFTAKQIKPKQNLSPETAPDYSVASIFWGSSNLLQN